MRSPIQLWTQAVSLAERLIYFLIAVLLIVMASLTVIQSFRDFGQVTFSVDVTSSLTVVLNDALFVIILMELLGTVTTHIRRGGFQLKPFLIIGIISSVRRILVLGGQLSASHLPMDRVKTGLAELLIDSIVVVALSGSLWIISKRDSRKREISTISNSTDN